MATMTPLVLRGLLKKPGRHPVENEKGLYFRAVGDGKAYWVFRYRLFGHEREMSLSAYPEVTLVEARAKHAGLRAQVLNKTDPMAGRRSAAVQPVKTGAPTFAAMAEDYVETHESSWRNRKHRAQWRRTLTVYCRPISDKLVSEIATADVLACLKPLWGRAPETASRLRGRVEVVLDAARALGHIAEDKANPARWRGHLDKLLPKPKKLTRGHHKALGYADVPALVQRLQASDNIAALALEFLILTATRTRETLGAQWQEFDLAKATWTIPASRMKIKEEFNVPLSDRAVAILAEARQRARKELEPDSFVFPGARPKKPLSDMSLAMMLRRLEIDATTHGMRSSFRMWCSDVAHVEFELAESCLSHRVGSAVSRAYARSDMLERRRPIMSAWANHVTGKEASNVIELRRAGA